MTDTITIIAFGAFAIGLGMGVWIGMAAARWSRSESAATDTQEPHRFDATAVQRAVAHGRTLQEQMNAGHREIGPNYRYAAERPRASDGFERASASAKARH